MAKALPRFDAKDEHVCSEWKARDGVDLNMSASEICNLRAGQENLNPAEGVKLVKRQRNNANLYISFFRAENEGVSIVV